jgi:hypothetical protein
MTNYQTQENEKFLNKILELGKFWIWPDANATYVVENGLFIANTKREFEQLKGITSKKFHEKIKLRKIINN